MKYILGLNILLVLFFCGEVKAQDIPANPNIPPHSNLSIEDKVNYSDLVIEGKVVRVSAFFYNTTFIYTSIFLKPSKIFKGAIKDSLVELIIPGGRYPNGGSTNWGYAQLSTEFEGLLFLRANKSSIQSGKSIQSYFYTYGQSLMGYNRPELASHKTGGLFTTDGKNYYYDLERELFQRIEAVTGQKRKVLGPNTFEIEAAEKQQK